MDDEDGSDGADTSLLDDNERLIEVWSWIIEVRRRFWHWPEHVEARLSEPEEWPGDHDRSRAAISRLTRARAYFEQELHRYTKRNRPPYALRNKYRAGPLPPLAPPTLRVDDRRDEWIRLAYDWLKLVLLRFGREGRHDLTVAETQSRISAIPPHELTTALMAVRNAAGVASEDGFPPNVDWTAEFTRIAVQPKIRCRLGAPTDGAIAILALMINLSESSIEDVVHRHR